MFLLTGGLQYALLTHPMTVLGAGEDERAFAAYVRSLAKMQIIGAFGLAVAMSGLATLLAALGFAPEAFFALAALVLTWQLQEFCRRVLLARLCASRRRWSMTR